MSKIIDWGFPKEAESCGWKDLWRAWAVCLLYEKRCRLYIQFIIPIGRFVIQVQEELTVDPNRRPLQGTGWYRFIIRLHFLNYFELVIQVPLGKWRKAE